MIRLGLPRALAIWGAILLFFAPGAATAQVSCDASVPAVLTIASTGTAELLGDYVLTCTGGAAGATIAGAFTVYVNIATAAASQPKLLVDEGSLATYSGTVAGSNTISFQSVVFAAPGASARRILKITGIRVNAASWPQPSGGAPSAVLMYAAFSGTGLTINNVFQTVALIQSGSSSVAVSVSPTSATVQTGAVTQFTATVTGTADTSVTWSVNNVAGGNATCGTISPRGLYTAPAAVPDPATVTVRAASVAEPTKSATASVTVVRPAAVAVLSAAPASLSFIYRRGSQPSRLTRNISVASSGALLSFAASAAGGNWLSVSPGSGATPAQLTVTVNAADLAKGVYQGSISISSAAASNSPLSVPVTLTVTAPVLVESVLTKALAARACDRPVPVTGFLTTDPFAFFWFTVEDAANGDAVTIEWYDPAGSWRVRSSWPSLTSMEPGVRACFASRLPIAGATAASMPGTWSARVFWNGIRFVDVPFTISALAPRITLSASALAFPAVAVGSASGAQVVRLTNSGSAPLNIRSKSIGGTGAGDFSYTDDCAGPIAAGSGCAITVVFAPTATGSRSAFLRVDSDAVEGSRTVSLTGTAVAAETAPLLERAFKFSGPYPEPAPVTYTDTNGQTVTGLAYPGQIFLVVPPDAMDADATASLVQANGGSIIGQIPAAGLYWVQVGVGTEAAFIGALQADPAVILVVPDIPLQALDANPIPLPVPLDGDPSKYPLLPLPGALIAQIDVFDRERLNDCGLTHGESVNRVLAQHDQKVTAYEYGGTRRDTRHGYVLSNGEDVGYGLARVAAGAMVKGQKLIVNVSLGFQGPNDGEPRDECERDRSVPVCSGPDENYAAWKTNTFAFWVGLASELQHMPDDLRDNTLLVVAAGNSGLDMTRELRLLRDFFPKAFEHMLIVGATQSSETEPGTWTEVPSQGYNHAYCLDENSLSRACGPGDPSMLYAPGVQVPIPGADGCMIDGTSFAAPQVANLAARLARKYPNLTTAQLVSAIMTARSGGGMPLLPAMQQVESQLPKPSELTFTAPENLPAANVGTPYGYSFCDPNPGAGAVCGASAVNPSGGAPPYTFAFDAGGDPLPEWISLSSNGLLAGTPANTGRSALRICVTDAAGARICRDTSLEVQPPDISLLRLDLDPATLVGGVRVKGTVTLSGPAGPAGVLVKLTSDSPFASVQSTVTVPATKTSVTFSIVTYAVTSNTAVIIDAWLGSQNRGRPLLLIPAVGVVVSKVELDPSAVTAGQSSKGTVTLNAAVASDTEVTLRSDSPLAEVERTVKVQAGTSSKEFTVTTSPVNSRTQVTISASAGGVTRTATLTLNPATSGGGDTWIGKLTGESTPGGTCVFSKFFFDYTLTLTLPSNAAALLAGGGVIPNASGTISGTEKASRDSLARCTLTDSSISNVPVTVDLSHFFRNGGRILVNAAQTLIFQRVANGPVSSPIRSLVLTGHPVSDVLLQGTWTSAEQADKAVQSLGGDFNITKR